MLTCVVFAAGTALRFMDAPVLVYTPDEDAYADFYASRLFFHGLATWPQIVRDYEIRPEMHAFPSPTRIGHLAAIVGWMHVTGEDYGFSSL